MRGGLIGAGHIANHGPLILKQPHTKIVEGELVACSLKIFQKCNGMSATLSIGHECGYEAFLWGVLSHRPDNQPGQSPSYVVCISGKFLRRLPEEKRILLSEIL